MGRADAEALYTAGRTALINDDIVVGDLLRWRRKVEAVHADVMGA